MSEASSENGIDGAEVVRAFSPVRLHHTAHHVLDLGVSTEFFERVFGLPSIPMSEVLKDMPVGTDFPRDYAAYTPIRDMLFDSVNPEKFVIGGVQKYASINKPHLKDLGWYVEGMPELYRALQRNNIRVTSTFGDPVEGDEVPMARDGLPAPFHTVRDDTGLRFQFYPAALHFPLDVRTAEGWVLPPVSDQDPLGIVRSSHYTILSTQPERAFRLLIDVLGGRVVHEQYNDLLGASCSYVHLADAIFEYAVPEAGTAAYDDWQADGVHDTYHAITWKVVNLERTERHLSDQGVKIRTRSDDTLITVPETSLGVPWGFTTRSIPGDPRD